MRIDYIVRNGDAVTVSRNMTAEMAAGASIQSIGVIGVTDASDGSVISGAAANGTIVSDSTYSIFLTGQTEGIVSVVSVLLGLDNGDLLTDRFTFLSE